MKVNPFYLLLLLYTVSNLAAVFKGYNDGGLILEGDFFEIKTSSLIVAFTIQSIVLFFFYFFYKLFFKISIKAPCLHLSDNVGHFLIFLQISFIIFNIKEGVNVAGVGATVDGGSVINYLFVILQPDLIFIIFSVLLSSNKLFVLNVFLFLISMFLRGWMGGVFIVFFLLLIRFYPINLSVRNATKMLLSFFILIAIMPFIIYAKWSMRSGDSFLDFYLMIPSILDLVDYSYAMGYLLNRFQHVGHVAIMYEHSIEMMQFYDMGKFDSFWFDGLPQYIFMKSFSLEFYRLNSFMVEYFFGIANPTWNTNPGLAGWIVFLQERLFSIILYLMFFFVFPLYFVSRHGGYKMLLAFSCFTVLYLYHGWFGAYFNFMFYCSFIVFIFKSRFKSRLK